MNVKDVRELAQLLARHEADRCTVKGCNRITRLGKPWCSRHVVSHSPYARALHRLEQERRKA